KVWKPKKKEKKPEIKTEKPAPAKIKTKPKAEQAKPATMSEPAAEEKVLTKPAAAPTADTVVSPTEKGENTLEKAEGTQQDVKQTPAKTDDGVDPSAATNWHTVPLIKKNDE
ncbi:MAG: hypothetical protein AAFZ92_09690, partial [Pseudomonadota bacterium]